jgi:hypothetical protein
MGSEPRQVVLVQIRFEPEVGGEIGERLERRPLLTGDTGDLDQ